MTIGRYKIYLLVRNFDTDVVIGSSRYGWEIYKKLVKNGVDESKIYLMQ